MYDIKIDKTLCIGCGLCADDCPQHNLKVVNKKADILIQDCIKCGHCLAICPKNAVKMTDFSDEVLEVREAIISPEDLLNKLRFRRSIRHFEKEEIDKDIITDILEAGRLSQSGGNKQKVRYIVIEENLKEFEKIAISVFKKLLKILKKFTRKLDSIEIEENFFFKGAPLVIVVVSKDKIDGSIAANNMVYIAESFGLGTLYSGFFAKATDISRKLRKELGLKRGEKVTTAIVFGYTKKKYFRNPPRKPLNVKYL